RGAAGHGALDPAFFDLEALHRIRQEYQRLPRPPFDDETRLRGPAAESVAALRRDGIVRLPGFVPPVTLRRLRRDSARWLLRMRLARLLRPQGIRKAHYDSREYWRPTHRAYVTNDALAESPALGRLCQDPVLLETAGFYLQKPFHVKRIYAMHYRPAPAMAGQQFGWHHDMEDRQLKIMVLLTDIGPGDQPMSYVRGSHRTFRSYEHFLRNELDFESEAGQAGPPEVLDTFGAAGDVFLFDSNGMHRGNRSRGRARSALFVELTADANPGNVWGTRARDVPLDDVAPDGRHPLALFLAVTPKWELAKERPKRKRPTWAESLETPAAWLGRSAAPSAPPSTIWQRVLAAPDHTGANLATHLEGTASFLRAWGQPDHLERAGRYHAVCGNPSGREPICGLDSPELAAEIGDEAAQLVRLWSRLERASLSRALHTYQAGDEPVVLRASDGEPLPVGRRQYLELAHLYAANEAELLARQPARRLRENVEGLLPILGPEAAAQLLAPRSGV
ncbi:MAG: hypothetical protein HKP30_18515, partial [Myxococcales bacterium]|nr:hypothetical protein [Myxococcales bacterium]